MQWLLMTAGPARWLICLECGVQVHLGNIWDWSVEGLHVKNTQVHRPSKRESVEAFKMNEDMMELWAMDIHLTAGCNCNWCALNEHERQKARSTNERKQRSEVAWGAPGSTREQILDTRRRGGGRDLETILFESQIFTLKANYPV